MTSRSLASVVAAIAFVASSAGALSTASAASSPTITGPTRVPYYGEVTLTGSTQHADQHVLVYFRGAGQKSFRALRDLHSDAAGRFRTSYRATQATEYYARSGSTDSAHHVTKIVSATCTTSGPAFRKLPVTTKHPRLGDEYDGIASFAAVRGDTWMGNVVTDDGMTDSLVTWRPHTSPRVLARYHYTKRPTIPNVVHPVGASPDGRVVATVELPTLLSRGGFDPLVNRGLYWTGKHARYLSHAKNWFAWTPIAVVDNGGVVGWAASGSRKAPHFDVVVWARPNQRYRVLVHDATAQAADAVGDIVFAQGSRTFVRTPSGVVHELVGPDHGSSDASSVAGFVAGRAAVYATTYPGLARWSFARSLPAGPATAHIVTNDRQLTVRAVGRQGGVVLDGDSPVFLTASGARARLPRQFGGYGPFGDTKAVSDSGRVAFTAPDRRVHFFTCR